MTTASSKFTEIEVDKASLGTYWNDKYWPYKLKHDQLVYKTIQIGQVKFFTVFSPAQGKPKARLLFVHGFAEYHKAYEELYEDLSSAGYEVFFYDQRGAGLTSRGKLRGQTNNRYTIKDLDNFIQYNYEQKDPAIPLYLAGHSMGGGIILNYLICGTHKEKLKGAVACAPLVLLHPATKPSIILEKLVIFVTKFKENIPFDTKLNEDFFTGSKEYTQFLMNDALSKPTGTMGQIRDMILTGRSLLTKPKYEKFDTSKSLLIIHSKDDHINWYKGSQEFMQILDKTHPETSSKRKLILYEKSKHSLFLEAPEPRAQIIQDVVGFLDNDVTSV